MQKHPLELMREAKSMGLVEFCAWLEISHNTYKKIIEGRIDNAIYVDVFVKINKKTTLDFCDLVPDHILCKLIKR